MRRLGSLLLLIVVAAVFGLAQATGGNPSGSIEKAREDQMNERLRGKSVLASDESLKPGRSYDMAAVKKKTIELNTLIQSVDGDVVQANKGVVSADLTKKLKRIEKLAKEIRQEFE